MKWFVFFLVLFYGCGKRITSNEKHYFKKDSLIIQNNTELKQNYTWNDIGLIKPFDNSKPFFVNGKEYFNAVIKFDKTVYSEIEIKANENLSYKNSENSETKKETKKVDYSNLLFVIGILIVLCLVLKKNNIL